MTVDTMDPKHNQSDVIEKKTRFPAKKPPGRTELGSFDADDSFGIDTSRRAGAAVENSRQISY